MTDDATSSAERNAVVTVGGPVDEIRVTLALYGDDLDPAEVTHLLGCQPTDSHRRGEIRIGKKTGQQVTYRQGAWLLTAEALAPRTADDLTGEVLGKVSSAAHVWRELSRRFDVQLRYGIFVEAWNREFSLSSQSVQAVAGLHASLEFDIYANIDAADPDG